MTGDRQQNAPGVVEVRMSGQPEDAGALASVLERLAGGLPVGGTRIEILTRSAPYANRRDPGQRVYMLVRVESGPAGEAP